jgi:hypothetical protein
VHGGGYRDSFIAHFDSSCVRQWGSFFGGPADEYQWFCVTTDASYNLYLAGMVSAASSSAVIVSNGAHQPVYGGGTADLFIEKFDACLPTAPVVTSTFNACIGQKAVLQTSNCGLKWYADSTLNVLLATGNTFTTNVLFGDTTFYVTDRSCGVVSAPAVIQLTSAIAPTVTISNSPLPACVGESVSLVAGGAISYSGAGGGAQASLVVTPSVSTIYSVTGAAANGCKATSTIDVQMDACVGLTAYSRELFSFYPNPVNDRLTFKTQKPFSLMIRNPEGQLVKSEEISSGRHVVDLSGLPVGLYLGSIRTDTGSHEIKIVVAR